ncbi:MAG: 2-C-methyl-D-erythritol 4-phosphate cytidylyltransferase [Gammaproteobacteria bacterium]|nr:2-C-methyl-D-erythritol 4-phosphate cytidylyltransferase [Gammaproteobacteria bacterium]
MAYWAVIPAAGAGTRMAAEIPKQYLSLRGRTIIEHTLERFLSHPRIAGIVVSVAAGDPVWPTLPVAGRPRILRADGGAERCHSVLNALKVLVSAGHGGDWGLVHDAARPCVRTADIDMMIDALSDDPVGGILAVPVRDTMKRAGGTQRITATVERSGLWRALTPQMFRVGPLATAIERALDSGVSVTDEAQAMELIGQAPRLVEGHADNIKITRPQDLELAELYLRHQEEARCA